MYIISWWMFASWWPCCCQKSWWSMATSSSYYWNWYGKKLTMIKGETTWKTDSVDLGDLKRFSMEDSTFRKQKSTDFFSPISGKKIASNEQHQSDRSDIQHCTKNKFFQLRTTLSCVLKVQLVTSWMYSIVMRLIWINSGVLYNHLFTWVNHLCQKLCKKNLVANVIQLKKVFGFFVKNSSSQPQFCSELNTLKTRKTQSKF